MVCTDLKVVVDGNGVEIRKFRTVLTLYLLMKLVRSLCLIFLVMIESLRSRVSRVRFCISVVLCGLWLVWCRKSRLSPTALMVSLCRRVIDEKLALKLLRSIPILVVRSLVRPCP